MRLVNVLRQSWAREGDGVAASLLSRVASYEETVRTLRSCSLYSAHCPQDYCYTAMVGEGHLLLAVVLVYDAVPFVSDTVSVISQELPRRAGAAEVPTSEERVAVAILVLYVGGCR